MALQVREMLANSHKADHSEVDGIIQSYHEVCALKNEYVTTIEQEASTNEVLKQQKFQSSKLNIKLQKFKGYESDIDIYTFQSDFEKLHKKSTPSSVLPDLLKNNYLDGPALSLVKGIDKIDEIWTRLKSSYGDAKLLLSKKLALLTQSNRMWRTRDPEKLIESISKILNVIKDVIKLAKQHSIERNLFYGNAIKDIYALLDDKRQTKWFESIDGRHLDDADIWKEFITFLEKELSIQQMKLLNCTNDSKPPGPPRNPSSHHSGRQDGQSQGSGSNKDTCFICGEEGHNKTNGPKGSKLIQYYSCRVFVEMTPSQRFNVLKKKGYCWQCLYPGALRSNEKHKEGRCQRHFICKHDSHDNFPTKKHVLVCQDHASNSENGDTLQKYKDRYINRQSNVSPFSKDIKLVFFTTFSTLKNLNPNPDVDSNAIYILQTIEVDGQRYTIFFDLGCSDMVITEKAVKKLGKRASLEFNGKIPIGGVGKISTISSGGYKILLPLSNGQDAEIRGLCLKQITSKFPVHSLKEVQQDISKAYKEDGFDPANLPSLPASIGGEVDIMLGIKYKRYHPKEIYQLPSGLTIFESLFKSADGGRGVVGGPHRALNKINKSHIANKEMTSFIADRHQILRSNINPDTDLLHMKVPKDHYQDLMLDIPKHPNALVSRNQKIFEQAENAGSEITYRCINCRDCKDCKNNASTESISIREEIEQQIINRSITVDIANRTSYAHLPLLHKPEVKLSNNKHKALKVYY